MTPRMNRRSAETLGIKDKLWSARARQTRRMFSSSWTVRPRYIHNIEMASRRRGIRKFLFLLLITSLTTSGCGGYQSQAEKYLTEASSQIAAVVYVLERRWSGAVTDPFTRSSLWEYATAMQTTGESLRSLDPPFSAIKRRASALKALSRAQRLAQAVGRKGIEPNKTRKLARRLRGLQKELKTP
jgi:uncharacterized protein YceK